MTAGRNRRFVLELPEGWSDRSMYLFEGPTEGDLQHVLTLVLDPDPTAESVEDYARERIEALEETLPGMQILKRGERGQSGGLPAYEVVYRWIPADGRTVYRKHVYLLGNGMGCTFSASFSKKTLKTLAREVDAMIDSFRLEPPA